MEKLKHTSLHFKSHVINVHNLQEVLATSFS